MSPADLLRRLRRDAPLVQCITNYVAMNIAANVVLAVGASPAMVHAAEEIPDFTPIVGALTINIGTLSAPWRDSMLAAAEVAQDRNIPWVLDPVAHFISAYRRQAAQDLLARRPTVVRGNASEILALVGEAGLGKGADSGDSVDAAQGAAQALAQKSGAVVAVTGPVDFVTDGERCAQVTGGSHWMPQVTALGCGLTALIGGYAAVGPAFDATLASLAHYKVAGSRAGAEAKGPGSFQVHFLDQLAATRPEDLAQAIRA
ncbi:hydroxyethylthiazole kinase [Puniceibacterium sediminis]|uniref:Hydroxyethylthiazole kinase n=1 Tax=Puniceibacterium sediminis TaxID=1608407 RepID=A0A238YFG3_9RHOB|nr:hydroxyethylthiazole kinase [Puniceibacterium sediminis]SNR69333.1 hydroxyethylthiazole kinase [Puniceibacterium sediminis]